MNERYNTVTGSMDRSKTTNALVCNRSTVLETTNVGNLVVGDSMVLPPGIVDVTGSGYVRFLLNTDPTLDVRMNNLVMPCDATPATGPYQWVRLVDDGTFTITPPTSTMWTEDSAVGWHLVTTPGDEHIIIDEDGFWMINYYMRCSSTTTSFITTDVDFDLGITPPMGTGPTLPTGDGFATGSLIEIKVAAAGSGMCFMRLDAGTRLDMYLKCESVRGFTYPGGTFDLILEQNGSLQLVRLGA
jgi:hypothetical protein